MDKEYTVISPKESESNIDILSKIPILAGLSAQQLQKVYSHFKQADYLKDEIVYRQGERPSHIYIIRSGAVKITISDPEKNSYELIELLAGDCFGETSVLGIQPHSATAMADQDTELMVLERRSLFTLYEEDKELFSLLILNIARETCRRLHKTDEVLIRYILNERKFNYNSC